MLESLANQRKEVAEMALVRLTESLLPNPFSNVGEYLFEDPYHETVLREIQKKYGLKQTDFSDSAKTTILKRLSSELSGLILSVDKRRSALNRIANRSGQQISKYDIKFSDLFRDIRESGISETEVIDAINWPDLTQNLIEVSQDGFDRAIMLFTKQRTTELTEEKYTLLIHADRDKDVLTITSAFRIFNQDYESSTPEKPSELLQKFVQKFGLFFRFGNSYKKKFMLDDIVNVTLTNSEHLRVKTLETSKSMFSVFAFTPPGTLGIAKIRIAYTIDLEKYKKSLVERGFRL